MLDVISPRVEYPAAVVVSETFKRPDFRKRLNDIQHFLHYIIELFWDRDLVRICEGPLP